MKNKPLPTFTIAECKRAGGCKEGVKYHSDIFGMRKRITVIDIIEAWRPNAPRYDICWLLNYKFAPNFPEAWEKVDYVKCDNNEFLDIYLIFLLEASYEW